MGVGAGVVPPKNEVGQYGAHVWGARRGSDWSCDVCRIKTCVQGMGTYVILVTRQGPIPHPHNWVLHAQMPHSCSCCVWVHIRVDEAHALHPESCMSPSCSYTQCVLPSSSPCVFVSSLSKSIPSGSYPSSSVWWSSASHTSPIRAPRARVPQLLLRILSLGMLACHAT